MLCGGVSAFVEADEKTQKLCDHVSRANVCVLQRLSAVTVAVTRLIVSQVRAAAEEKAGKKFPEYTAKTYKKQLVSGTNYFIKVEVCVPSSAHVSGAFT